MSVQTTPTAFEHGPAGGASPSARSVAGRRVETTAPVRCGIYGALSELVASPHDLDARPSLRNKIGLASHSEYAEGLDDLLNEFVDVDLADLKRDYSGLFEVGDDGPPVPIREDLQTGQRAGTREDLVRFYGFFKYKLDEKFSWSPDHLSVELEFMHFLCYREATVEIDALSYQLAQFDFAARHLCNWLPGVASNVESTAPGSLYSRIVAAVCDFVVRDHAWQAGTIVERAQTRAE